MFRLLFIIFCMSPCLGQELTLLNTKSLQADTFIGVDSYENTYAINDNILSKIGTKGTFQFNDIQLGEITSVDIINPLKVVVYYNDFNTVVFLDNRLSEIERISFNNLPNFINTGAARNAGNNRLWLLNTDTQQLELYNYRNGKSSEISQPLTDAIVDISSNFNYLFVLTDRELRQYNVYGGLMQAIKISEGAMIAQDNENLLLKTTTQLLFKPKDSEKFSAISYQEILPINLQLRQDLLYFYNGEKIATFSLNPPKKY